MPDTPAGGHAAPIPRSFVDHVRSFGPGLVMVLTWLGAGDVIDMATAGANYGYALMWMFVVAVLLRFLFVSLIARYQLCNQHGEGVLDGLARLHPLYPPLIFAAVVVMGHIYGAYMSVGVGEIWPAGGGRGRALAVGPALQRHRRRARVPSLLPAARGRVPCVPGGPVGVVPRLGAVGGLRCGRAPARPGPNRDAGPARDLRSLARGAGDGRRGRRVADEPGLSVLPGGERLARAALPARAALRPAARHPRHAGAQPGGVDSRCRAAVPGPAHRTARGPAQPADRRPRTRWGPALLRRVFAAVYTRSSDTPSASAAWAATPGCAGGPAAPCRSAEPRDHRCIGGSRCGVWSRRWSGRCQGCRDLSG